MKTKHLGLLLIVSAFIWGLVIVGCSFKLKGTNCYDEIKYILYGGVLMHFIIIWFPMASIAAKEKKEKQAADNKDKESG